MYFLKKVKNPVSGCIGGCVCNFYCFSRVFEPVWVNLCRQMQENFAKKRGDISPLSPLNYPLVPGARIELAQQRVPRDFKSLASTSSATRAEYRQCTPRLFLCQSARAHNCAVFTWLTVAGYSTFMLYMYCYGVSLILTIHRRKQHLYA